MHVAGGASARLRSGNRTRLGTATDSRREAASPLRSVGRSQSRAAKEGSHGTHDPGLIVGLGIALLVAAPVAAGTASESRYFERGHYAFASERVCTSAPGSHRTTCRDLSIDVFKGRRGARTAAARWRSTSTGRPDPASDSFTYYRLNDAGCEFTYTDTRRGRRARTVGDVDGSAMRMRGALVKVDLQTTEVCQ
ncbi:hypothetical protein BH24CHL8_BH24CHL8_04680 [soil metagenome]